MIALLTASGCGVTLPNATYRCKTDEDCPPEMVCGTSSLCVYRNATGSREPAQRLLDAAMPEPDATAEPSAPEAPPEPASRQPSPATPPSAADGCSQAKDCAAPNDCALVRCEAGHCVTRPVAVDTPLPSSAQVKGDCQTIVCDGNSGMKRIPADADLPADDGNVCHSSTCADGKAAHGNAPDGRVCNATGSCHAGECSVCTAGKDCTPAESCTIHETQCVDGKSQCVDTQRPVDAKTCGTSRVCSQGQCVMCVLGASCGPADPCQPGTITSCERGPVCTKNALDGPSCGADAAGNARVCRAGACVYQCRTGACDTGNACETGRWMCGDPEAAPRCVAAPSRDGTRCGDASVCHDGACAKSALVNGSFAQGVRGWTAAGDGATFPTSHDAVSGGFVRTNLDGSAVDTPTGSLSQRFTVPMDAIALRFAVAGGHAHVRLLNAAGRVIEDVTARDSNDVRVPVNWDLSGLRGQTLSLSVDDELSATGWSFIAVSGFDVIRDTPVGLVNPQFQDGLNGWTTRGDGRYFNVFDDPDYVDRSNNMDKILPEYGARRSLSSYVYDTQSPRMKDAATGSVLQRFVVPSDAVALRFYVHGGKSGRVVLYDGATVLQTASGMDSNDIKVPVAWDLRPHVGRTLTLAIEDDKEVEGWSFISTSGFDVITSYNGP